MDSLSILVPLKVRTELNLLANFKDFTSHRWDNRCIWVDFKDYTSHRWQDNQCIWEFDQLRYPFVLNLLANFKDYTSHRWKDNSCIWEPDHLRFSICCVHFSIYVLGLCLMISNIKIQFQTQLFLSNKVFKNQKASKLSNNSIHKNENKLKKIATRNIPKENAMYINSV